MKRKSYDQYKLEDFLADSQFKQWVLHKNNRLDVFWKNWIQSHPEKKELISLAREVLLNLKFQSSNITPTEKEAALKKILVGSKSNNSAISTISKRSTNDSWKFTYWPAKIAAVWIFLLTFYFLYQGYQQQQDNLNGEVASIIVKTTGKGEKYKPLHLPDGSKVFLNGESSITYPEQFEGNVREVKLSGEAYFEVKKDEEKPFKVVTTNLTTEVLGTSFNVNAYPGSSISSISLVTGSVKVLSNLSRKTDFILDNEPVVSSFILNPGEKLSINTDSDNILLSRFDPEIEVGWKDGLLKFVDEGHEEIFSKLERWYGVEIRFLNQPTNVWNVSGRFSNLSLERVMENLAYTHNLRYTISGKEIKIEF